MPVQLATIGVVSLLLLPWIGLSLTWFGELPVHQRLALGVVLGLAATVSLGYVLAAFGLLGSYWIVYLATVLLAVGTAARARKAIDLTFTWPGWDAALAVVAITVAYALPTFSTDTPIGWDPAFHSILAKKVLDTGALAADWLPFEEIALNYPLGSHTFIALVSSWSGQEVHQTFQALHMVIQVPAAILVCLLSRELFDDRRAALFSMLAYALLCWWGSFFSYYQWGGLPTEIAFLFFLGLVWSSLTADGWKYRACEVVLLGSLILAHHLSALIATVILGFYVVLKAIDGLDTHARRIIRLFALTFAAYGFYIVASTPCHVTDVAGTETLRFDDEPLIAFADLVRSLGYFASILGVAGLVVSLRRPMNRSGTFLLCWFTSLVLAFTILGYGYRFVANVVYGVNVAAFTPSRFGTVLSYPLAIYAGVFLSEVSGKLESVLSRSLPARVAATSAVAVLAAGILAMAVPSIGKVAARRAFPARTVEIAKKIRSSTPENAFIFYRQPIGPREWVPYLTWRPTTYTPIPASEDRRAVALKSQFFRNGPTSDEIRSWLSRRGLRGYLCSEEIAGSFALYEIESP